MRGQAPSRFTRAQTAGRSVIGLVVALLVLGCAPAARAQQQDEAAEPQALGLAALTQAAIANYPGVRAAQRAIEAAEAQLSEARVSPFFQFEVTGAASMAPNQRGTPTYSPDDQLPLDNPWGPVLAIALEGIVPIYTFGKIRAGWDAAEAGVAAAEHGRRETLATLRRDVRRAYFALQLALDVEQMIREGQGRLEQAADTIDERIERGDPEVRSLDRYRLQAAVAEVRARSSEAKRLEASAREALRLLTGKPRVRIPPCPSEAVDFELGSLERYQQLAVDHRPEADMLDAAVDAREAELSVQKGQFFPDIAIALQASQSWAPGITDQENPFIQDRANLTRLRAALVARWSLDLWGNVHRVQRSESQLAEVRARSEEADVGIRLEVARTYEEVVDARRREEAWGEAQRQTRSWFVAAAQGYQVGTLEPKELVDAVRNYFQARFNHLQAIREYNTAVAELERTTGTELLRDDRWHEGCGE